MKYIYVLNDDKILFVKFVSSDKWDVINSDNFKYIDLDVSDITNIDGNNYYIKLDLDIKNINYDKSKIDKIKWITIKTVMKKNIITDHELLKKLHKIIETIDNRRYEKELNDMGITLIAGVDEVGRGPLYGPVVTAAVILPKDYELKGLTDSKKLTAKQRDKFYDIIRRDAVSIGIGMRTNERIDEINIYEATKEAMYEAIDNLSVKPEYILIDAMKLDKLKYKNKSIIKGDAKSISIAAASVIAKVTRDKMLDEEDKIYPEYGFAKHKGYPTKSHIEAIEKYGILPKHRKTYAPIKDHNYKINHNSH